ncbi:MAG TPA: hypothetical protein VFB33_04245 [Candidatus Binataceae bacterium]|jgi:hypothetical protein|nr:hypothetical protein [Candidatus Binataceae bacterium]
MRTKTLYQIGLGLLVGAVAGLCVGGCSTAGWGPPPVVASAKPSAQEGAPPFVHTTGMRLTKKEEGVKVPPSIRVQDCGIVAISSPARFVCSDGKVYTSFELARAREERAQAPTANTTR